MYLHLSVKCFFSGGDICGPSTMHLYDSCHHVSLRMKGVSLIICIIETGVLHVNCIHVRVILKHVDALTL